MKLIHLTTAPTTLTFLRGQVSYMKARSFEVICVSSPGEFLDQFAAKERVVVRAVSMARQVTPLKDLATVFRLWRLFKSLGPDIVHAHTPKAGLLGMLAAWLAGVKVRIYHLHGLPLSTAQGLRRALLLWSEKTACRLAGQVFCVSPSLRQEAAARGVCPLKAMKVLVNGSINGVDAVRFDPARLGPEAGRVVRRRFGVPAEALVIGFVGRLVRDKGLAELVEAWQGLRREFPELHLLVVGPFEARDAVPEKVARIMRQEEGIHLIGQDFDTPRLYAAMDVFVLPSRREGFPVTPLEAAAMELPVVATRITGCVDAVQDGLTGTLAPPGDVPALSAALRAYLADARLRRRHGRAGRERVISRFAPEPIWEALAKEYQRLLAGRSREAISSIAAGRGGAKGRRMKRFLDVMLSLIGLVITAPLLAATAAAVRLSMGRPVFFRQVRPGLQGRPFTILKFRTMTDEVDSSGRLRPDERRLTRLGHFLRRSSLDELPELINILKGDMSLVGPRPLLMAYLTRYSPTQARRHEVKPGLTGWAQVKGRNAITWEEKFDLDVWYVDHRSLGLDLKILALTMLRVLKMEGVSPADEVTMEEFRGSTKK